MVGFVFFDVFLTIVPRIYRGCEHFCGVRVCRKNCGSRFELSCRKNMNFAVFAAASHYDLFSTNPENIFCLLQRKTFFVVQIKTLRPRMSFYFYFNVGLPVVTHGTWVKVERNQASLVMTMNIG